MTREITFDRFIRGLMTIAGIIIAYLLISRLSGALLPFLIAWLFCYLVYPIVKFFQYRLKFKSRALSIITVLLLVTGIMVGISFAIIPPIIEEAVMLKEFVTNYLTSGSTANNIPDVVNNFIREHIDMRQVEAYFSADRIGELIKGTLPKLWNVVSHSFSLVSGVGAAFMVLVYIFFILSDYETLEHGWVRLIPEKYRERVVGIATIEKVLNPILGK